jgi:hypothetical protein
MCDVVPLWLSHLLLPSSPLTRMSNVRPPQQQPYPTGWSETLTAEVLSTDAECGDRIILPQSALESLVKQEGLNDDPTAPFTFRLCNPRIQSHVYAGVLEFSAKPGVVRLPRWMFRSLQLQDGDIVEVSSMWIPKGTWTRLKPLSVYHQDIRDYRWDDDWC